MEYLEQLVRIGAYLSDETRVRLVALLMQYSTVFGWKRTDLTCIDSQVIQHSLNVTHRCNPIKQKMRGQEAEWNMSINVEVVDLVNADILR